MCRGRLGVGKREGKTEKSLTEEKITQLFSRRLEHLVLQDPTLTGFDFQFEIVIKFNLKAYAESKQQCLLAGK